MVTYPEMCQDARSAKHKKAGYVTGRVPTCVQEISLEHATNSTYVNVNIRIGEPGRCSRHSDEPRAGRSVVRSPTKANSHLKDSPDRL